MKHLDYLYFNIYNHFYRISQYRQSLNPRMQAMYMFSLGSGGWVLFLEALYLRLIKHTRVSSKTESIVFAMSIYMLSALLFSYIFIVKDRDQKIFGKYEALSSRNPKRNLHFIISIAVLLLPYLGLAAIALLLSRHV